MAKLQRIRPCLWFDTRAEEAARFYAGIFKNSSITATTYYWERLGEGGDPAAQICGWLKDKFGVSWQVVPANVYRLYDDSESPGARAAMEAMMKMKKIDIATLQEAHDSAHAGAR